MTKVFLLGECMVELRKADNNTLMQSFAGDTYNTAVYLKRSFTNIQTSYITAIGNDSISNDMLATFESEKLDIRFVFREQSRVPGLYLIDTDKHGERSFTYWRDTSAAKKVVQHIDDDILSYIAGGDVLFFSGVSLAVIESEDREKFWQQMNYLSSVGVKIIFDPNYRPRMWQSPQQAKSEFEKAFAVANMLLPGIEDFEQLYGIDSASKLTQFLTSFDIEEIIIKNGSASVTSIVKGEMQEHTITPVTNVVDTTSAGDAFNGAYLGARISGQAISQAIEFASAAAGFVIQHKGAIAPADDFQQFIQHLRG